MADHVPNGPQHLQALDLLSLLVAVLRTDGSVLYANAALEQQLGMSRRTLEGADFTQFFTDPALLQTALAGTSSNDFAALRYEASLRRLHQDPVPVHVNVAPTDTRRAVAGDGAAKPRTGRIHPGDRARGGPPAELGGSPAGASPPPPPGGRCQHP